MAHFRISEVMRLQASSNLPLCDKEPITEYAFQIPPTGTRGHPLPVGCSSNSQFSRQACDNDFLEVSAVMRQVLSVTRRLLVLMRLDLFFTGVPNFPPPAEAVMLRVGGERALLLTGNFSRLSRGK